MNREASIIFVNTDCFVEPRRTNEGFLCGFNIRNIRKNINTHFDFANPLEPSKLLIIRIPSVSWNSVNTYYNCEHPGGYELDPFLEPYCDAIRRLMKNTDSYMLSFDLEEMDNGLVKDCLIHIREYILYQKETKTYCSQEKIMVYEIARSKLLKYATLFERDLLQNIMGGRGNGKTKLAQKSLEYLKRDKEMMLNYIKYNEMPKEENMEKMTNFRKDLEYLRRDKKNYCEFGIKVKDSCFIRKIVFQGATKKDLYSDALVENVLIIASQMVKDNVYKVIFDLKNKMTIIFPWAYGFPEKVIVKANGSDSFDILNGYTIAKAKMLCSDDGYEWLNKLKKSGKVDV